MIKFPKGFFRSYIVYTVLALFTCTCCDAQRTTDASEQLFTQIDHQLRNQTLTIEQQIQICQTWISRAKKENNFSELFKAYAWRGKIETGADQIKYGDSLLQIARKINDNEKIGEAYLSLGSSYVNNEQYQKALSYYLSADQIFKESGNPLLMETALFHVALVKIYIGEYEDANRILIKNTEYFRNNARIIDGTDYRIYYLHSLISLIDTNSKLSELHKNSDLIKQGKDFLKKEKIAGFGGYFLSAEGIDSFITGDYSLAISRMTEALNAYDDQWDHLTEHYYLGMSYWKLQRETEALPYLLKIDNELNETGKLDPVFRPAIETLLTYYRKKGDYKKQLEYLDKLIKLNKLYESDYKFIYTNLNDKFDNKILLEEKNKLQEKVGLQKNKILIISVLLSAGILVLSWFAWRLHNRKKYYKKIFEEFKNNTVTSESDNNFDSNTRSQQTAVVSGLKNITPPESDLEMEKRFMPPESILEEPTQVGGPLITENIEQCLQRFELEKKYMKKNLTLSELASYCGTNTTYLSKYINTKKNKNFSQYLIDLRIEHIINQWKTKPKTRHLTIQEISSKAGFSTAQSFSKNFQEKYNISPSYFLKRINEDLPN